MALTPHEHATGASAISPSLRLLLGAACAVIVMGGMRAASPILGPLLLGLLLAYAVLPFPNWIMRRFKVSKSVALALTAAAVLAFVVYMLVALDFASLRIAAKLPTYQERLASLYERITIFMSANGVVAPSLSAKVVFTPEHLSEVARVVLPGASVIISNALLIPLFAFLFIVTMLADIGVEQGGLAERLAFYASDAQSYVAVTAKSAGINALLNLVFLVAMGVDTPVVWSFLYFFLDFIPTLGFVIALVPPTIVTLLMYGWKRALFVAGGLILTNLIVDNVVTPIFMKHAVRVSFLEITLSLVAWAFLLGLAGAILAIPLTLSLKKFVEKSARAEHVAMELTG
ncbi:MAG: AI-2E family transporter [Candidatus Acidiferrales bacterium]